MKTEKAYLEIMDQLEIIHAENLAIYDAILTLAGVNDDVRKRASENWDKRFQDERKKYND